MGVVEGTMYGVFALVLLGGIVVGVTPALYRRTGGTWISRVGAPIDADILELVRRERGRRLAWSMAGALVGLALGVAVSAWAWDPASLLGLAVMGGAVLAGGWAGQALRAFTVAIRPDASTLRVAHATAQVLTDVVDRRMLTVVRLEVLLATVLCGALATVPLDPGLEGVRSLALWLAAAVIMASWVIGEWLARILIRRPLPGVSPRSLPWHEALRREIVADLCRAPTGGVLAAAMMAYFWTLDLPGPGHWHLTLVGMGFYFAALAMSAVVHHLSQRAPTAMVVVR